MTTKILIIRFSSIGDIVLTTPVARMLKNQLDGETEIHYLTKKKFAFLLAGNPHISKVHTIDKSVQEVIPELIDADFDYVIDLHRNIRSRIIKRRLKKLSFTFDKLNVRKWIWVNFGINLMPDKHIVERYLDTTKAFGIKDDRLGLDYFIPSGSDEISQDLQLFMSKPFVAFAIGGAHTGKRMSADKLASVCDKIPYPLLLLGGPDDAESAAAITAKRSTNIYNATGKLSVDQSAMCLQKAEVVISGDTGMMHIASAFKKKIISIWGCTVPGFGMYPYRPDPASIILEPVDRKRRPCSKLGNRCKYGQHKKCIDQLQSAEINAAIEKLWAPQTKP